MYSVLIEKDCSVFILLMYFCKIMYWAVKFNTQTQSRAIEIKDIGAESMLLSEPITI